MSLYVGEGETVEDLRAGRGIERVVEHHSVRPCRARAVDGHRPGKIGGDVSAAEPV